MKVWLRQKHNQHFDSFRYAEALFAREKKRVVVICPDTENVLINCSRPFFDKEVENGRIILSNPNEKT